MWTVEIEGDYTEPQPKWRARPRRKELLPEQTYLYYARENGPMLLGRQHRLRQHPYKGPVIQIISAISLESKSLIEIDEGFEMHLLKREDVQLYPRIEL